MCGLSEVVDDVSGVANAFAKYGDRKDAKNLANQTANAADPFAPYRSQYAAQLSALMSNPGTIVDSPGYKFGLDQGLQAVQRKLAAGGYGGSGNEAIALNNYAQDYGMKFYNDQIAKLTTLSGATTPANFAPAIEAQKNAATQGDDFFNNLGELMGHISGGGGSSAGPSGIGVGNGIGFAGPASGPSSPATSSPGSSFSSGVGNFSSILGGLAKGGPLGMFSVAKGIDNMMGNPIGNWMSSLFSNSAPGGNSEVGNGVGSMGGGASGYGSYGAGGVGTGGY